MLVGFAQLVGVLHLYSSVVWEKLVSVRSAERVEKRRARSSGDGHSVRCRLCSRSKQRSSVVVGKVAWDCIVFDVM